MNAAISSVLRTQVSNSASASKIESETIKSAEEVSGGLNTASETSVSSKFDTLELSREYLEYKTQGESIALQDKTSQLNSTVVQNAAAISGEELIYSVQLYAYTDLELLEMVNKAMISREQYDAEISSREANSSVG